MYSGNQTPTKDKTHEIPKNRAVHLDCPNQGEARGEGLHTYVCATLAISVMYPTAGVSSALEKLAVAISLPGQKQILVKNWYLTLESSQFLQRVGLLELKFQTELQQFEIICANMKAHDLLWDPVSRPTEKGEILTETMLDANGAFQNTGAPTSHNP